MNAGPVVKLAFVAWKFAALVSLPSCSKAGKVACELNVKVEQDDGTPVEGANASVRYPVGIKVNPGGGFPTDRHETTKGATNADGEVVLRYETLSSPEGLLWIKKDGYYTSIYEGFDWDKIGGSIYNRRADIEAVFKRVENPIPMHVALMEGERAIIIPEMRKEYEYDLQRAAMVAPLGNGVKSDLLIKIDGDYKNNNGRASKFAATIRFADSNDGLIYFETPDRDRGSEFLGDYSAPQDGWDILRLPEAAPVLPQFHPIHPGLETQKGSNRG